MKFSMTGLERGDLLIQVTVWTGFTVHAYIIITYMYCNYDSSYFKLINSI